MRRRCSHDAETLTIGVIGDISGAVAVMLMAFVMGFAIRRGSICMVEASRLLVVEGRPSRLVAFATSSAVAACAILPLAWLWNDPGILYDAHAIGPAVLLGGAGFGLGAWINGGCAFGTLGRLSGGQSEYAATIAASLVGAMLAAPTRDMGPTTQGWFAAPGWAGAVMLVISAILIVTGLSRGSFRNLRAAVVHEKTLLQPVMAMALIGLLSGLLFALAGSWTHMSVLGHESEVLVGRRADTLPLRSLLGGAALLAGAVFAALRSGRFRWQWPTLKGLAMRITGGLLMGYGAAHIPGGNGALLTHGVPSGAASAWVALAMMMAMLALLFLPMRLRKGRLQKNASS